MQGAAHLDEQRRRRDVTQTQRAAEDVLQPIGLHEDRRDGPEAERHDREVIATETDRGRRDQHADQQRPGPSRSAERHRTRGGTAAREGPSPTPIHARRPGKQRRRVRADREEDDKSQVQQAGVAHDDVETERRASRPMPTNPERVVDDRPQELREEQEDDQRQQQGDRPDDRSAASFAVSSWCPRCLISWNRVFAELPPLRGVIMTAATANVSDRTLAGHTPRGSGRRADPTGCPPGLIAVGTTRCRRPINTTATDATDDHTPRDLRQEP